MLGCKLQISWPQFQQLVFTVISFQLIGAYPLFTTQFRFVNSGHWIGGPGVQYAPFPHTQKLRDPCSFLGKSGD